MVIRLLEQSPSHAVRVTAPFTQGGLWCGATGENHPLQIPSQSGGLLLAAGLDGGNTIDIIDSRTGHETDRISRTVFSPWEIPFIEDSGSCPGWAQ